MQLVFSLSSSGGEGWGEEAFFRVLLRYALLVLAVLAFQASAFASVIVTPATGGIGISADKAANATSPAWTSLGPIVITEQSKFDIDPGSGVTLVLKAPAGFEFNTSSPPNVSFLAGQDISSATLAFNNATTITVTLNVANRMNSDQFTIGNSTPLQVRPTSGTPLASGQIFRPQTGGGTAVIAGITISSNPDGSGGTGFGSLSEVVGVAARLVFTTQPGSASTGAIFGSQPVVVIRDQFGNPSVTSVPASLNVSLSLTSGTGPLLGTTLLDIGTGAGNGTVSYSNLQIDSAGTNKQLTASASGLPSALSAVFAVNGRPTISSIPDQTVNEDTPITIPFTIGDLEASASALLVSAISSNTAIVPNSNLLLGGTGASRTLTVTPATNISGFCSISISVSDGTVSASTSFGLTINSVNDPPAMVPLTALTILEDATNQTVNLSGITPGPSNESAQTVTITAASSNPGLIPNPTLTYTSPDSTGALNFTPVPAQFGTATISVVLKDNGGTANGGIDSFTNTFVVTVQPMNDPPTLNPINDVTINANAGLQTVNLTGISPGPANESTQAITITASSSNLSLIPNPTPNYANPNSTGTLTFTPVPNASGTATITVRASDNGGTANGGQDNITRQFNVTVNPIADLAISQTAIPNPAFVGGTVTFRLTVTNAGPTSAAGVQVTNILPAGTAAISVNSSQGSSTNYGSVGVCSLGTLANAGTATIDVVVSVPTSGTYSNFAAVSTSVSDPNSANNNSSVTASVIPPLIAFTGATLLTESCSNGGYDPGETVTVSFALQNNGSSNTTNLQATLKAVNGVILTAGPQIQNYGALIAGGPAVSRSFTFSLAGNCSGTFTAVLQLQDGATSLGTVSKTFGFGHLVNTTTSFSNANVVTIPSSGAATPYPSTITVSGLNTNILKVTATLNLLRHSQPGDLDILLVSPTGQKTLLMSDCGFIYGILNTTLTFDDASANILPYEEGQITNGTYKPTDYSASDVLASPAPAGPYVASLSVFNGANPNGVWQLYVFDDTSGFSGNLAAGWTLNLTTAEPACCIDANSIDVAVATTADPDPVVVGNNVTFTTIATNLGPATATSVTITNPIPPNTALISATSSQGSCSTIGNSVVCSLGTLTNGASAALSITFQPTQTGPLTNLATISALQPDHALLNNTSMASVAVVVPSVSIGTASVLEGDPGTSTNVVLTLQLSSPSSQTVSIGYVTADITATAGTDYAPTNGTVVFTPGQTTKTLQVTVLGDTLSEATEFFGVILTNPVNVSIGSGPGLGTIIDDDPLPTISISDASVREGDSGTTNMLFAVNVNPVSGQAVTFNFATSNGSALAGSDFVTANGTLTIPANQPAGFIAVPIIGDTANETNETFFVSISGVANANLGRSQALGTIINDDFLPTIGTSTAALISETCSPANGAIDPNENVTVSFPLRIISAGTATSTNLVATLLQMGGIINPGAPQAYGALSQGGPAVARNFSFTANGSCGNTITAVLSLQDGASNLGFVTNALTLGNIPSLTNSFANSATVSIPESGTATPYPSTINVPSLSGTVTAVTATLFGLSHTFPADMQILLVGPGGQSVLLLSDAGDGNGGAISNVNLTFDDTALTYLPAESQIFSGTYKPTDIPPAYAFPPPAPGSNYAANLSVFNGLNPAGVWSLYVADDSAGDAGSIAQGWGLKFTTVLPPSCCGGNSLANLNLGVTTSGTSVFIGSNISYTISVTNFGPNAASDVLLTDALPSNASLISATSTSGPCTNINGVLTCNFGTMQNLAGATVSMLVRAEAFGPATSAINVSSHTADPSPANNSITNSVIVTNNPAFDVLFITAFRISGSNVLTTFTSQPGRFYRLEYKDSLSSPAWTTAVGIIPGNGQLVTATHLAGAGRPSRFYRVRLLANDELIPVITSLQVSNTDVIVKFTPGTGQSYRLEYTDSLTSPSWTTAVDSITGTGDSITVTHLGGATRPFRYYRIRQLP